MFACTKGVYVVTSGFCVCVMNCPSGDHVEILQVSGLARLRACLAIEIQNLAAFNPTG